MVKKNEANQTVEPGRPSNESDKKEHSGTPKDGPNLKCQLRKNTVAGGVNSADSTDKNEARFPQSHLFRMGETLGRYARWVFGLLGLIVCLAFASTIPVLQFIALGYFFEVSGRVIRFNSVSAGFAGISKAERLASFVLGTWFLLWPVTLLRTWWEASHLLDPDSETTHFFRQLHILGSLLIYGHILAAWLCGGKLRYFFWPIIAPFGIFLWLVKKIIDWPYVQSTLNATVGKISPHLAADIHHAKPLSGWFLPLILWNSIRRRGLISRIRDGLWEFVAGLQLPYLFWLGFRGFLGSMIWLIVPVTIMVTSARAVDGAAILTGLIGIATFAVVATFLPFLQAHFASERRLAAIFELRIARQIFRKVPVRYFITVLTTFVFAVPLYILKIERPFPELLFLPGTVFILFMLPTRWISGWAYINAQRTSANAHHIFRWPAWLLHIPLALSFAGFVFLMRFVVWTGATGLFDQHAFLIPAPFIEFTL